jgi:uncharacterized membrane protein YkvA (DUF1232 family)
MAQTKTKRRRPGAARSNALLQPSDFTNYLHEKTEQLAPADLQSLLGQVDTLRQRLIADCGDHPRMQRQAELALRMVTDHAAGHCPQIPYYTVSLLAVALLYFADPLDVIPDWIPRVGTSDDALVFELAFQLGHAGVERYCTWKGLSTDGVLGPLKPTPAPPPAAASAQRVPPKRVVAKRIVAKRVPKRKPGRRR